DADSLHAQRYVRRGARGVRGGGAPRGDARGRRRACDAVTRGGARRRPVGAARASGRGRRGAGGRRGGRGAEGSARPAAREKAEVTGEPGAVPARKTNSNDRERV